MSLLNYFVLTFALFLTACSDTKLHEPPHEHFFQVGLFGHGRGAIGDLQLNSFYFERQCDSCHANSTDKHGDLGRCNQCHQPHISGWNDSILVRDHSALKLTGQPHHEELKCTACHQSLLQRSDFNNTRCQHCHNHQARDIEYSHDLMDNYDYEVFSQAGACIACHSRTGKQYSQYFDIKTGDSL